MTNKEAYIAFCEQAGDLPLFLQPWWLDAVTKPDGKEWEVLLAHNKQGRIEAAMPFVLGSKFGLRYALTPQLTQYTGLWIVDKEGESATGRLSREKQLQNEIIKQLETMRLSLFKMNFPLQYSYWSPFFQAGYRQETRYTYRIEDLSDRKAVFGQMDATKQNKIRKAEEAGITIDFEMSADEFYDLQCLQLSERGDKDVLSRALVRSVVDNSRSRGQGLIARAKDANGATHSAIFVPWDSHNAYDLMTAIHPNHRSSGASTLMVWEAMKEASRHTHAWDFEGSMIEGVENSFRQFGGIPVPYFTIEKQAGWLQWLRLCKK